MYHPDQELGTFECESDYPTLLLESERRTFFQRLLRASTWIPVFMAFGLLIWSTIVCILNFYVEYILDPKDSIMKIVLCVFIFLMIYWSFLKTITTRGDKVPNQFKVPVAIYKYMLSSEEKNSRGLLEHFAKNLPITNINLNGTARYCNKCRCIKPDRCHHCSTCKKCVLKMDHHCPWINNCVSFSNYKYFVLFLFYTILGSAFIILTTYEKCYFLWKNHEITGFCFHLLSTFFLASLLGFSTMTLFLYHVYLLAHNLTTIESLRKPLFKASLNIKNYDIGFVANFREVFGDNPLLWGLPVFTSKGANKAIWLEVQKNI